MIEPRIPERESALIVHALFLLGNTFPHAPATD